jgi:hypothetical protein
MEAKDSSSIGHNSEVQPEVESSQSLEMKRKSLRLVAAKAFKLSSSKLESTWYLPSKTLEAYKEEFARGALGKSKTDYSEVFGVTYHDGQFKGDLIFHQRFELPTKKDITDLHNSKGDLAKERNKALWKFDSDTDALQGILNAQSLIRNGDLSLPFVSGEWPFNIAETHSAGQMAIKVYQVLKPAQDQTCNLFTKVKSNLKQGASWRESKKEGLTSEPVVIVQSDIYDKATIALQNLNLYTSMEEVKDEVICIYYII